MDNVYGRWRYDEQGIGTKLLVLLLACLLFYLIVFVSTYPPAQWWLIAPPPLPAPTMQLGTLYPSNDRQRILQFESDQSARRLQQFYRTELPTHGWHYRCTVDLAIWTDTELMDVYHRDPAWMTRTQTLEVIILKQGAREATSEHRRVELSEWLSARSQEACSPE